jgi:hypothetical protein
MTQVDQQMKLDQMVAQARLENIAAGLPDAVQKKRAVRTEGDAGVDANNPFFKNVEQVRAGLVKSGITPEQVEAGVQDYITKVEKSIATSGATDEQKAGFAEAIARYRMGLTTDTGSLTPFGQGMKDEMDATNEAIAAIEAEEAAAAKAAGVEPVKPMTPAEAKAREVMGGLGLTPEVQDAISNKAKEDARKAELTSTRGGQTDKTDLEKQRALQPLRKKMQLLEAQIEEFRGGKEMPMSRKVVRDNSPEARARAAAMVPNLLIEKGKLQLEIAKVDAEWTAKQKARDERLGKSGAELAVTGIAKENKSTPDKIAVTAGVTPLAKPVTTPSKPFSVGKLELGEEVYDEFLTSVQKEAAAREFYKAKFGAVPVGFTDMYRKMYPEATVRSTSIRVNGQDIPIMIDAKGNATPLKMGEAPNPVEQAKAKAVTFANTEIADGVRLNGLFAGTVDGAQAFRKDYSHMANVRTAIARLVEINETGYESLSPSMRQEADQLQSEIIAALRVPIIGPGQVAVPEQEILQRIVKNPTGIFNLEASDRAALKGLMSRVDRELVNWPKSMGLEVNIAGNRSQTIRQLRLNRESKARMVGETN